MVNRSKKNIIPAVMNHLKDMSETVVSKSAIGIEDNDVERNIITNINSLLKQVYKYTNELENLIRKASTVEGVIQKATFYGENVLPKMNELRKVADEIEQNCAKEYWPFHSYGDLSNSVLI